MDRSEVKPSASGSIALIYVLIDPRTLEPRTIGKSSSGLARARDHAANPTNVDEHAWNRELTGRGLAPVIAVLEYIDDPKALSTPVRSHWDTRIHLTRLNDAEIWWIAVGKAYGWTLLNKTAGGSGVAGYRHTLEAKEKNRQASTNKRHTSVTKEKIKRAHLGRALSEVTKNKLRNHRLGKRMSPEAVEKMRQAHIGLKRPIQAIEKTRKLLSQPLIDDMGVVYTSQREAACILQVTQSRISAVVNNPRQSVRGRKLRRIEASHGSDAATCDPLAPGHANDSFGQEVIR